MTSSGMDDLGGGDVKKEKQKQSKSDVIEDIYQKKTQLEHILIRPDTYIGSVEWVKENMWIYNTESQQMEQKQISYVPGLYKIFDEILVNAADNKQRDPTMDCIKIDINAEKNIISVYNNGQGIPVVIHKGEKMYVPTMIFGHLLTSSNYNDEEQNVTGRRNGYGAKLCNIFSNKFTVETASKEYKRCFKQTWGSNMSKASEPIIKDFFGDDYTKITFSPDLSKFKMTELDKDTVDLLSRRAFDVAASTRGVKVFLNGKKVPVKSFEEYVKLYIKGKKCEDETPLKIIYESVNARWEVAATLSPSGVFQQVSFVNGIATTKGGRHVDHVADAICKNLFAVVTKKNKGNHPIKAAQIKSHMWIFINCLIVNPTFDSQTKENMTLQAKSFGSKCTLSEHFLNQMAKCGITDSVLSWAKLKDQQKLQKINVGRKQIGLLTDAHLAGSRQSLQCTLILTEGDSAETLAVSSLAIIGRDTYGVFPLHGEVLNVREATSLQIRENIEIDKIVRIMGLQYMRKYETQEDLRTLRYGKLMIMTDQDQDGSHIKGLLINFIHAYWPSLHLEEFIFPIVKATKKKEELSFYSLPEFEQWKSATINWHTYKIKSYKANNSDAMFDSLLGGSGGSGEQNGSFDIVDVSPEAPKPPPKKRPPPKKSDEDKPKKPAKKVSSVSESDSDADFDVVKKKEPAKKPAAPRKPTQKKKKNVSGSDEDAPKKKTKKKSYIPGSDDDDDVPKKKSKKKSYISGSDDDDVPKKKSKKKSYSSSSDDDSPKKKTSSKKKFGPRCRGPTQPPRGLRNLSNIISVQTVTRIRLLSAK